MFKSLRPEELIFMYREQCHFSILEDTMDNVNYITVCGPLMYILRH